MDLITKYGYASIPVKTSLFRQGIVHGNPNLLFFSLHPYHTYCSNHDDWTPIQVWETTTEIKLLFMIKHLNARASAISAIEDIYYYYFDSPANLNDLDIKGRDKDARKRLINKLKENDIFGWLNSFENKYTLEICLFPNKPFYNFVELISEKEENKEEYSIYNALHKINICPSQEFFSESKDNITWPRELISFDRSDHYSLYDKLKF